MTSRVDDYTLKKEFWFKYFHLLYVMHKQNKYLVPCENLPQITVSSRQLLKQCEISLSTRLLVHYDIILLKKDY